MEYQKEPNDADLRALQRFYSSVIETVDLPPDRLRTTITYDLSLVPEHLRTAVVREMTVAWQSTLARVREYMLEEETYHRHFSIRARQTKDERDAVMRKILNISGKIHPWPPEKKEG